MPVAALALAFLILGGISSGASFINATWDIKNKMKNSKGSRKISAARHDSLSNRLQFALELHEDVFCELRDLIFIHEAAGSPDMGERGDTAHRRTLERLETILATFDSVSQRCQSHFNDKKGSLVLSEEEYTLMENDLVEVTRSLDSVMNAFRQ